MHSARRIIRIDARALQSINSDSPLNADDVLSGGESHLKDDGITCLAFRQTPVLEARATARDHPRIVSHLVEDLFAGSVLLGGGQISREAHEDSDHRCSSEIEADTQRNGVAVTDGRKINACRARLFGDLCKQIRARSGGASGASATRSRRPRVAREPNRTVMPALASLAPVPIMPVFGVVLVLLLIAAHVSILLSSRRLGGTFAPKAGAMIS